MSRSHKALTRRNFGLRLSALTVLAMSGAGCTPKDLPAGTFDQSEIRNPKNTKYYSKRYTAPKNRFPMHQMSYAGQQRTVHTYIPKTKPITSVLLLLHGSNRTGASMIDKWRPVSERHGICLIAPDSLFTRVWSFESDSFEFMQTAIETVTQSAGLPSLPIYGFGHSAGAVMMTHLSIRHGSYFKAVGAHAGNPNPRSLESYRKSKKPRAPLTHVLGDRDHIFKTETAIAASQELVAQGQDVNLILIKKHNHWYYDLANFVNQTAWESMTS